MNCVHIYMYGVSFFFQLTYDSPTDWTMLLETA